MTTDEVMLSIGRTQSEAVTYSGWNQIRITRSIQHMTGSFDITLSDFSPAEVKFLTCRPGDFVQVILGSDVVLTGFVNAFVPSIANGQHRIRIVGRGKCQDLIDCSAEWPTGQIAGSNVLQIARQLVKGPYGIDVTSDGNDGPSIPLFQLIVGETPYDILERLCRYSAVLFYELPDGNLYLSRVGEGLMSSGAAQGVNVEAAVFEWTDDQRYSFMGAWQQTMQTAGDSGANIGPVATAEDRTVIRNRKLYFQSEQIISGFELAKARVAWEQSRRSGQSQVLRVTLDSWRDEAGALWEPNSQMRVDLSILKIPEGTMMLIADVTYRRDENGTHAELVLMPPSAFTPEPIILQNIAPDAVLGATSR